MNNEFYMDHDYVLNILRSPHFLAKFIRNTEIACSKSFWRLCERKQSIRNLINSNSDPKSKLTISNRISVFVGEEFEEEICPSLKSFGLVGRHIDNSVGDITINDQIWEIKTSKHNTEIKKKTYTLQGATHSNSKCSSYIFIRYELDFDKRFRYKTKPNHIIKGLHFSVHKNIVHKEYWVGKESNNNSRTTLQIPIEVYDDFNKGVLYGDLNMGRKYIQFRTIPFNLPEYEIKVNSLPDILGVK